MIDYQRLRAIVHACKSTQADLIHELHDDFSDLFRSSFLF